MERCNCGLALNELKAVVPGDTRNVGRVGFGGVAFFPCSGLHLLVHRVLDYGERAGGIGSEDALVFVAKLTILPWWCFRGPR